MNLRQASDVIVIGGGIVGCMLAYDLVRAGMSVELIERGDIGREASGASAGIISPPTPRLASRLPLAVAAFRRYPGLLAEVEDTVGRQISRSKPGRIEVSMNEHELRESLALLSELDVAADWLTPDDLADREPAVTRDEISGAVLVRESFGLSLNEFCVAVADAAAAHGATITRHTPVHTVALDGRDAVIVRTASGDRLAGSVIIAAGAWSDSLFASSRLSRFSIPVRGEMIRLTNLPIPVRHVVSGLGGYIVPQPDGSINVGATEDWESGFNKGVTAGGLQELISLATRILPSVAMSHVDRFWAGLRPASSDREPIIGPHPDSERIWLATGHFRSGALLAPATSEMIVRSMTSGSLCPDLGPLSPSRFVTAN